MKLQGSEVRSFSRQVAGMPAPDSLINVILHLAAESDENTVKLQDFCTANSLTVEDTTGQCWRLWGTVANFEKAFGVSLFHAEKDGAVHRDRSGWIEIPDDLDGIIDAVLGLDNPPIAHFMYRVGKPVLEAGDEAAATSLSPRQVGQAYGFPLTTHNGFGSRIAVIELGGKYNPADMATL